jgi:hypothetical protein
MEINKIGRQIIMAIVIELAAYLNQFDQTDRLFFSGVGLMRIYYSLPCFMLKFKLTTEILAP